MYIINLVNSLDLLNEREKPEILLFYKPDLHSFLRYISYSRVQFIEWKFSGLVKGYILSWMRGDNAFCAPILEAFALHGLYPVNDFPVRTKRGGATRVVSWIPDLQHKFYPAYFGKIRVFFRELRIRLLLSRGTDLVVSSRDVRRHFHEYYRLPDDLRVHVLRFASRLDESAVPDVHVVRPRYKLPDRYFIVSNQFTNHKNHHLALKALSIVQKLDPDVHIVFTGKMEFKGNEQYIKTFRKMIVDLGLESHVSLLGVIPREDQLCLMKHSVAVIQPSLFEGWSTVIEDAMALNVPVIASDLAVNKEQLGESGLFFNRHDEHDLAQTIALFDDRRPVNYQQNQDRVLSFARDFVQIFR